jgi:hypothetical protein
VPDRLDDDLYIDANGCPTERVRLGGHCLDRRLFTLEEAHARLAEDDMVSRRGAASLRQVFPGFRAS